MTNHYRSGAEFERAVRAHLIADGYEVIRSAGSKTKIDLVVFKPGQAVFVQCKRDGRISPAERVELLRLASYIGALPVVAWKQVGRSAIHYWRLTGPGPQHRIEWNTDLTEVTA